MFDDFKELLSIFNAQKVKYLIVGGYAVSFHAQPRATKDIDVLIKPDADNAKAVLAALANFGAAVEGLTAEDFIERDKFFRMGRAPVMVDIISEISGVDFDQAWQQRVEAVIDPQSSLTAFFISREDLIAAKLAAGEYEEAIRLLRERIDADPGAAGLYLELGLTQAKLGRHMEAVRTFQTMIRMGLDGFLVHRSLYLQYEILGNTSASQHHRVIYLQKYDALLKLKASLN